MTQNIYFKNRYRIPSARAAWWCYGCAGAYFITICTAKRQHFFGQITQGRMALSPLGQLAETFWYQIPQHAQNVELGAFIVMHQPCARDIDFVRRNNACGTDKIASENALSKSGEKHGFFDHWRV
ncbi:hypothetical protein HZU77_001655 [Neisseriaceae bacterium TC5R-5]|nr:hypothetical protein [Neisseriaceae bacterium TC5R-5]